MVLWGSAAALFSLLHDFYPVMILTFILSFIGNSFVRSFSQLPLPHPLASTPTETPAFVSTSQPDGPLYTPTGTPKPGQHDSVPAVSWLPLAVPGLQAVRGEANTCYAEQFRVRGSEVGPDQVRGCIT